MGQHRRNPRSQAKTDRARALGVARNMVARGAPELRRRPDKDK